MYHKFFWDRICSNFNLRQIRGLIFIIWFEDKNRNLDDFIYVQILVSNEFEFVSKIVFDMKDKNPNFE